MDSKDLNTIFFQLVLLYEALTSDILEIFYRYRSVASILDLVYLS